MSAPRPRAVHIANAIAGLLLIALAVVLWRDPGVLIRAEFAKQRILLGAQARTIVVGGHRIVYSELPADAPNAPTVVLLHGYTGSKENWYRMARQLRGRYRLLMPDLPGWGESERKPDADYGYVAQSARIADFIAAIAPDGGRRPVVLVGHSMGGGIAALTAARAPTRVERVALFNAAGVRFEDNRFGRDVLAGKNPFAVDDAASLQRYLGIVFEDRATIPPVPWPADRIYIAQRRASAAFEQRVLDKIGRGDERFLPGDEAADIRQPALLLWCAQDRVIDPSALRLYAEKLPQASKVMLQGCGHMSLMERPAETAAALEMLIQRGMPR